MIQLNKTQNEMRGKQAPSTSQVEHTDKLKNMLHRIVTQQAAQSNMQELGRMVSAINQRLSPTPPTVSAAPPERSPTNTSPEANSTTPQTIIKPSEFFSGDADHFRVFLL